jgi:hypothetical protein
MYVYDSIYIEYIQYNIYIYIYIHICMCMYVYMYMYVCMYVCMYAHVYVYILSRESESARTSASRDLTEGGSWH